MIIHSRNNMVGRKDTELTHLWNMNNKISTLQLADSAWPKFRHDVKNTGQSQFPSYADGTLKWATDPLKMIKLLRSSPAISSLDIIYVADSDGVLRAFNSSLVQQWIVDTGAEITSQPTIDPIDGTIYVGNLAGTIYAINPNGSIKWSTGVLGAIYGSIAIGPNPLNPSIKALYVGSDSGPGYGWVFAIDPTTGDSVMISIYQSWYYIAGTPIRTTPAIGTDGTIYAGSEDGRLHAIMPTPYGAFPFVRAKWTYSTPNPIDLDPVVSPLDGTIYFGSVYTGIYCINSTGTLKWTYGDSIQTHPIVDTNGNVYYGYSSRFISRNPAGVIRWVLPPYVYPSIPSKLLIRGAYVYVGRFTGICAYALSDGTPKYPCDMNFGIYYSYGTPVIASTGMMYAITFNTYEENALQAFSSTDDPTPNVPVISVPLYARSPSSAPVIATDGTIYFGSENRRLYATNPDGSSKWTSAIIDYAPIMLPPAVGSDDTIYVSCEDGLFAISSDGMSIFWEFYVWGYGATSPTIDPTTGFIYVADDSGNIFAIDPVTYVPWDATWQYTTPTEATISSCPAIGADGTIYFGDVNGDVYAIDPTIQDIKWSVPIIKHITTSPAISPIDGTIYITAEDTLYSINDNITDGSINWSYTPYDGALLRCSPTIGSDGTIYITTDEPTVEAVNPDGSQKWAIYPEDISGNYKYSTSSISITTNGILLVGFDNGDITAYNKDDGTELWDYTTTRSVVSSPAIAADGTIYVTNNDGNLYAFESLPSIPPSACPTSLKYEGDIVTLQATPRNGIGPYYAKFVKTVNGVDTVISSYTDAPEDVDITYVYTLIEKDIRDALSGTIDFSVYIEDSCPTGVQTCTDMCTINIGCRTPVCNFAVT